VFKNPNQPHAKRLSMSAPLQSQLAARNEFAQFKEKVANMMKNKLGIDLGNTKLYQEPYRADFDYAAFPLVGVCPNLLNLVVMIIIQLGNTLANILLN
jgi:hypothetical protein